MSDGVTVTGTGTIAVPPDVLRVSLAIQAKAADVAGALDSASAGLATVLETLAAGGVSAADVTTANLSVQESWGPAGAVDGYQCSQSVQAVIHDLGASGALLRELAVAGGDQLRINDVSLDISDRLPATAEARAAAFADARSQAVQYAELAGRALGQVLAVVEGPLVSSGARYGSKSSMSARAASAPVPVAAGSLEVSVSVQVQWSLLG